MQISRNSILLTTSIILSVTAFVLIVFQSTFMSKDVVYVDNIKLFDGFNMTKEMKKIGETQFLSQKTQLDSLFAKIQKSKSAEQQLLMKQYVTAKEDLTKSSQEFAYSESQKIWKRLEAYTKDFSEENNYSLIIGSEKKQDVLFASEDADITLELINYVNSKYEGAK